MGTGSCGIKTVKIMVDVFEFPHIPYWFSIRQAIGIIKKSVLESAKCVRPIVILVFDEKYNLVGTLTHINILKGIEPNFLKPVARAEVHGRRDGGFIYYMGQPFTKESTALQKNL